ncbi:SDR family NAD(P)-dependent oxidoreductase [Nocardia sp. NPDC051990]|uniref:SDR family NAD(P)-dependent oxidoreductase n=1 Tax=Nocardia sp. NPDC051990 TaxID=3155285 RepID=UPI0034335160
MLEFRTAPPHLPDRKRQRPESIEGLHVLVTDACSEIGRATATLLAEQGAQLLLVARRGDQLVATCNQIAAAGGTANWFRCDISALGDVDQLVEWVLSDFGRVDVLINNAGRPLRRPVSQSLDRFRDYQRMMATNYFGPLRLTLGLLPAMLESGSGQVINVGPWSLKTGATANFASYASSQAAWTTFGQCADAELAPRGIQVTAVQYPAVQPDTGTIAHYVTEPALEPTEAARLIETAIRTRPARLEPRFARTLRGLAGVAPRSTNRILSRLARVDMSV